MSSGQPQGGWAGARGARPRRHRETLCLHAAPPPWRADRPNDRPTPPPTFPPAPSADLPPDVHVVKDAEEFAPLGAPTLWGRREVPLRRAAADAGRGADGWLCVPRLAPRSAGQPHCGQPDHRWRRASRQARVAGASPARRPPPAHPMLCGQQGGACAAGQAAGRGESARRQGHAAGGGEARRHRTRNCSVVPRLTVSHPFPAARSTRWWQRSGVRRAACPTRQCCPTCSR